MENKIQKKQSIAERFVDQLYMMDFPLVDENGNALEIPESGYLGLLATGYKGLVIWRKKRGTTYLYSKFTKGKQPVRRRQKREK